MADTLGILAAPLDYQQIAALSAEHRVYVFGDEAVCLQLNIPVENRANVIDPRFQMDISKQTSVCENDEITTIALLSARALHVQIVAIDIITVQRLHYVIDVNPHASWHWLSHEVCSAIQTKFESFVATLLMKKNVGAADIIAKGVAKDIALLSH
ncbi:MAG: RimK-like ATP-grasp domain [Methylobacteriaceae bacterium]|nr:RimK-like ATP-grasp domain [Methylobacteriaceae bacterium]